MAAHGQQPLRYGEVAVAQRAIDDSLLRQDGLQLAPQRDAFEERPRLVEPGQTERERRIHVEMAVHERRADEVACGIDLAAALNALKRLDRLYPTGRYPDVDAAAPVGQGGVPHDQVEAHGGLFRMTKRSEQTIR
jgi:hypothetical protein